jgi:hypothetical protein
MRPKLTKEFLMEEFWNKNKSITKIAKEYNYSHSHISNKVKEYGLSKSIEDKYISIKFNRLIPIKRIENDKYNHIMFECVCDCGNICKASGAMIACGHKKSCGCIIPDRYQCISKYPSYQEISGSFWNKLIDQTRRRKLQITITIEYAWNIYILQERKCKLSGLPISFFKKKGSQSKGTASLDRIDSKKGYIEGNVQWLRKEINFMKQNFIIRTATI